MTAESTRRGILGAIAAVPLVDVAVAPAFPSSDLEVLIPEYQASSVRLTAGNEASEPQTHKRLEDDFLAAVVRRIGMNRTLRASSRLVASLGTTALSQATPFRCRPDYIRTREADCRQLATASRRLYDRFWRVVDRQVRLRLSNRRQANRRRGSRNYCRCRRPRPWLRSTVLATSASLKGGRRVSASGNNFKCPLTARSSILVANRIARIM